MRISDPGLAQPAAAAALQRCRRDLRSRVARLRTQPDDLFAQEFPGVVAALEAGFRHEETLLELLGDGWLHPRRADHAIILCALHRTVPQVEGGDVALGRQVADALDAVLALPCEPATGRMPDRAPPRRHARPRRDLVHHAH
ncbi:hypothetical protein NX784_04140 [Massilia pinisoli]|uniref:Uncharacterized protein n=1 Tax=Massilia pinisoli TaxID=1772194 RepID=A0ABT1ZLI2_9BURK|nr:hypothetical protein [Massilia pinisoli]MCS0580772.1 hypothetical protein [Massilia pinisoli]